MSRIFISHATADNAKTRSIIEWIVSQGWPREEIFVDFDDIGGGQRWREALTKAASRCEAVVFLISPEWVRRPWCMGEAGAAQMLGKQIIPVLIAPTPTDTYRDLLTVEYQLIDLTVPGSQCVIDVLMPETGQTLPVALVESGLQRLIDSLKRAGLDASTFPLTPGRKIYPGLAPLDTDDAAVFFGRDGDIARGIETLRQMRERGQSLLAILAASGAGKSSFLRAGLWPRLQRADREFLMLSVLRPGVDALNGEQGLVASLHRAGETLGLKRNLADWRAQIESDDFAGALSVLHTAARTRMLAVDAAQPASASQTSPSQQRTLLPPIPVLPIDQAEELFSAQGGEHARRLLDLLGAALREGRLIAVLAIRSDRYGDLQTAQALAGLEQRPFSLPPIADGVLKDVIEGPAQRDRAEHGANGLNIDPQLTDRLLRDWADADGLPLLAFTLRRLLDDYGSDGRLNLEDYERSGQLQGALEAAISRAMQAATAAGTLPEGSQEREALIRNTFVPLLVSVDPQSQKPLRRIALRSELPAETRDLIDRLIDARLLTCDRPQDSDATVEVGHEAILRHWPLLDRIIGQQREALIVLNEVKRDAEGWHVSKKSDGADESKDALLHRGERLRHAEQHLARKDFQHALGDDGRRYLSACRAREAREIEDRRIQQNREAKQTATTKKIQLWFTAILTAAGAAILASGLYLSRLQTTTSQESANLLTNFAAEAFDRNQYDRAVRFALAGIRKQDATFQAIDISAAQNQLQRAGYRSSLRAVLAHEAEVADADISPDGDHIVTAAGTNALLWDAASGRRVTVLPHDDIVWSVAFSPNGRYIVTASRDKTARLWSAKTGQRINTMPHEASVNSASFSHDSRRIATACGDDTAHIWDTASGTHIATMKHEDEESRDHLARAASLLVEAHDKMGRSAGMENKYSYLNDPYEGVLSADFSQDDSRIVTVFYEYAYLWDTASGKQLARMKHHGSVRTAVFSPDGTRIVTASNDRTAQVWDGISGQRLATMKHDSFVASAAFSDDGRYIITASSDNTARVWIASSGASTNTMEQEGYVNSATFSHDGDNVLTASADNAVRLWDATSSWGEPLTTMPHDSPVLSVLFNKKSSRIITVSQGKTARVWDGTAGRPFATMRHSRGASSAAFSPNGRLVVTASYDGQARTWNAASGQLLKTMLHNGRVRSAAFSPEDGHRILTDELSAGGVLIDMGNTYELGDGLNSARLWDTASGKPIATLKHTGQAVSASYSPDGRRIVTASDGTQDSLFTAKSGNREQARLWDAISGRQISTMPHGGVVSMAVFSPDSRRIVTASVDKKTHLWDAVSGRELANTTHESPVLSVVFSPNSQRFVTLSNEKESRMWDAESGREITAMRHNDTVSSAAFSPDSLRIVTISNDKTVRIRDMVSGNFLKTITLKKPAYRAMFSIDGQRIFTDDGEAVFAWDATSGRQLAETNYGKTDTSIHFSPRGNRFVATGGGSATLWDPVSGRHLATLLHASPSNSSIHDVSSTTFSPDGLKLMTTTRFGPVYLWDTAFFELPSRQLIDTICRDILNVDINTPPRDTDLSRLTDEELQMAAVIDSNTERDVCRPPTQWQRFASMFGIDD